MSATAVARVVERNAIVFSKLWRGSLFTAFISPLLFLAAMGVVLGSIVDENVGEVNGLRYLEFVAPAIMVATGIQLAATESLWPVMAGWRWFRNYYGMIATPVSAADVYGGFVVWTTVRVLISATVFFAVAAALGAVPSAWGVLAIPAAGLCAAAFCSLLGAYSVGRDSDTSFPAILRLGIVPLMLFSGTFFPVDQLPGWLRPAVWASPLWHGVELARAATSGRFEPVAIVVHIVALVAVILVGATWGVRSFAKRLTP
jgi:lipooligosaccharide transport system permease protein